MTETKQCKPLVSRTFLIRVLTAIQNLPHNWNRDILTFTAFLDDGEVGDHIMREFRKLSDPQRRQALELAVSLSEAR